MKVIYINPKTAEGVQVDPREAVKPCFFVNFNIIISHMFLKISLKSLNSFRKYEHFLLEC